MYRKVKILLLALFVVLMSACEAIPPTNTPLPAPTSTSTPRVNTPTAPPSPTIAPTPSPTADLSAFYTARPCLLSPSKAENLPKITFSNATQTLTKILNLGIAPRQLNRLLHQSGIGNYPFAAVSADLNGDHYQDAVVSIFDPHSRTHPPSGTLLLFLCEGHHFRQPLVYALPQTSSFSWGAPIIRFAKDLNADGKDEVVVSLAHCNDDTEVCTERYMILAYRQGELVDLLSGFPRQGIEEAVARVADPDGDHVYDFVVDTGEGKRLVWHYRDGKWRR